MIVLPQVWIQPAPRVFFNGFGFLHFGFYKKLQISESSFQLGQSGQHLIHWSKAKCFEMCNWSEQTRDFLIDPMQLESSLLRCIEPLPITIPTLYNRRTISPKCLQSHPSHPPTTCLHTLATAVLGQASTARSISAGRSITQRALHQAQ